MSQSSTLPVINLLNNLGILLLLMHLFSGIPFPMMFVDHQLFGLLGKSLRYSLFPRHTHHKPYPTGCLMVLTSNCPWMLVSFHAYVFWVLESAFYQRLSALKVLIRIRIICAMDVFIQVFRTCVIDSPVLRREHSRGTESWP